MNGTLNSNTVGIQGQQGSNNWYHQYVFNGVPANHIVDDSVAIIFYYPPYLGVEEAEAPRGSVSPVATIAGGQELVVPGQFQHGKVLIYDASGRLVKTVMNVSRIDLRPLPVGVYVVQLTNRNTARTLKLVVVK